MKCARQAASSAFSIDGRVTSAFLLPREPPPGPVIAINRSRTDARTVRGNTAVPLEGPTDPVGIPAVGSTTRWAGRTVWIGRLWLIGWTRSSRRCGFHGAVRSHLQSVIRRVVWPDIRTSAPAPKLPL